MKFDYYYGTQADQFSFVRIPKVMLIGKEFAELSLPSKVLYGLLLDRMGLSMKNEWLDEQKRVYIIYQISEIQDNLGLSKKKAIDYLGELEEFGLIEKKRRGLGLASIIYVKSFIDKTSTVHETSRSVDMGTSEKSEEKNRLDVGKLSSTKEHIDAGNNSVLIVNDDDSEARSVEIGTSRSVDLGTSGGAENTLQEVPEMILNNNTKTINIKYNNTSNLIESSSVDSKRKEEMDAYAEIIRENLELDIMLHNNPFDKELLEGIYDLILETVLCKSETILIASNQYPTAIVKSKFLKLNASHLEYVMDCLKSNTTKVKNIKKYILATLFNAPSTISGYYRAEVNHDFPQYAL